MGVDELLIRKLKEGGAVDYDPPDSRSLQTMLSSGKLLAHGHITQLPHIGISGYSRGVPLRMSAK